MKRIRLAYGSIVRSQRADWARFESDARTQPGFTVAETGLGVMTLLVDADSDWGVIEALYPLKESAGRHGIDGLRLTGDLNQPIFMSPVG